MSDAPKGTPVDWVADKALRGLIGTVMRLPYGQRVPFMGRTLRHAVGPLAGYRRRAMANLALIYPDMDASQRRALAAQVCDNFGRTLIENYSWRDLSAHLAGTVPHGPGLSAITTAQASNQPVIFVTGHFGNHEVPRHVLTAMGYTIGGLYRAMTNPYFNAHYAQTMTSWGGPVFEQGRRGTMGFARLLKDGGMGTLLFDVSAKHGAMIDFLGKPAHTATSAADLALRYDALVVPYFAVRQPDGLSFDVQIEDPIPHADPPVMLAAMNDRLAAQIARHPDQWFWVHNRWKPRKMR